MAPDDHSGARPAGPVVLRIKLRYDDVAMMVQRFAPNVGKSGLFLPTKSIQPLGTEVKFELRLANDAAVLVGLGRVKHTRAFDPAHPRAAFGMAIELMRVSREGRELIIKMIERRRAMGLPDVTIPLPEDIDAARRMDDSQPRADTGSVVRDAIAKQASAPVDEQVLGAPPTSGPIGVAKVSEAPRDSGAIPTAASAGSSARISVPVLAPEPTKARRPRVADLIAKANELSGQLAAVAVPGLDEHVDVQRALARARALAGSDLDGELSALRESTAAPLAEISIEAASAELARQLGGKPIAKRERSAKWVPPPAVEVRAEYSATIDTVAPSAEESDPAAFVAKTRAETEASPSSVLAAVSTPAQVDAAPIEEAPAVESAPAEATRIEAAPTADAMSEAATSFHAPEAATTVADQSQADRDDPVAEYAQDEKTRIPDGNDYMPSFADVRDRRSFSNVDDESLRTEPGQRPSSGLLIDDHADPASFERILEGSQPAMQLSESDIEPLHDDDDGGGESTHIGAMPVDPNAFSEHGYPTMADQLADQLDRQLAEAEAEADDDFRDLQESSVPPQAAYVITPFASVGDESYQQQEEQTGYEHQAYPEQPAYDEAAPGGEEISEGDVLAEADAADDDLLRAHGEADVHGGAAAASQAHDDFAASNDDFAARLDLGDDDYGSIPQTTPPFTPHATGEDFDEPHAFEGSVTPPPPARAQHRNASPPAEDLEDALAALDVDLDDVSLERRRARRRSSGQPQSLPSQQRPLPGLPLHRPGDTGESPMVRTRTGANAMIKPTPEPRAARTPTSESRTVKPTRPPPIPAAARKRATTPPPVPIRPPPRRAPTDEGVLIDFDDDE